MTKNEFLLELENGMKDLPKEEIDERVVFYSEMIDDLIDEGLSEEDAVKKIGKVEDVVAQIVVDNRYAKQSSTPKRRLCVWELVLLIIGAPVWGSLLISAIAVAVAIYVSVWAGIVSLWAGFVSLIACAVAGPMCGIIAICQGNGLGGIAIFSAGVVSVGVAIFGFFGCKAVTKYMVSLTKKVVLCIKNRLTKRRKQQ